MGCYCQIEDGPWFKAYLTSWSGGTMCDVSEVVGNTCKTVLTVGRPETLYHGKGISLTGYVCTGDNQYKLVSLEVRFRKPKDK